MSRTCIPLVFFLLFSPRPLYVMYSFTLTSPFFAHAINDSFVMRDLHEHMISMIFRLEHDPALYSCPSSSSRRESMSQFFLLLHHPLNVQTLSSALNLVESVHDVSTDEILSLACHQL